MENCIPYRFEVGITESQLRLGFFRFLSVQKLHPLQIVLRYLRSTWDVYFIAILLGHKMSWRHTFVLYGYWLMRLIFSARFCFLNRSKKTLTSRRVICPINYPRIHPASSQISNMRIFLCKQVTKIIVRLINEFKMAIKRSKLSVRQLAK